MSAQNTLPESVAVIILAAGRGSRMRSTLPKGLQPLGNKPLLLHLLNSLSELKTEVRTCVVAAPDNLEILQKAADGHAGIQWAIQKKPEGTGHAVRCAVKDGNVGTGPVLVLFSDVPLIRSTTLERLLQAWTPGGIALLSMELENPHGYGRILKDNTGKVLSVVEEADATESQARLAEVSTGVLVADGGRLPEWLAGLKKHRVGEYYLPDILATAQQEEADVVAVKLPDPREAFGANDHIQLQGLERYWQQLQAEDLMRGGVWLADSDSLQVRGSVRAGRDVFIDVGVTLEGAVRLGNDVRIGPYCVIRNSVIGDGTVVEAYSWIDGTQIGERATVGPFARLREGTRLEDEVRVGNFVETKNAHLREGAKASHLSYLGDADIGAQTNIGAGVITCNYDGQSKHRTQIGAQTFIGSNSALVAPVQVGDAAKVGAGSVVTKDVPDGALAIGRGRQKNLAGRAKVADEEAGEDDSSD